MRTVIWKIDTRSEEKSRKEYDEYIKKLKEDGEEIVSEKENNMKVTIKLK